MTINTQSKFDKVSKEAEVKIQVTSSAVLKNHLSGLALMVASANMKDCGAYYCELHGKKTLFFA